MSSNEIPIEEAQERALARLAKVLRRKLQTEAAALNTSALPTHPIPAEAVWRLGTEDDIAETLRLHSIGVFIMPDGASELTDARTGSPAAYGRIDRSTWRVLCLFDRVGAYEPQADDGVIVRPSEMVTKMAHMYKGALILTLLKYAIDSEAIHDLKVLNSYADYTPSANSELTGRASLTVEITQNVILPQPLWGAV